MYLTEPCTRCNRKQVLPPNKNEIKKPIILVRCEYCKKASRYNVVDKLDGSKSYWLSKWGRGKGGDDLVLVRRWVRRDQSHLSSFDIRRALDKIKKDTV
jgi:hypothetical protein